MARRSPSDGGILRCVLPSSSAGKLLNHACGQLHMFQVWMMLQHRRWLDMTCTSMTNPDLPSAESDLSGAGSDIVLTLASAAGVGNFSSSAGGSANLSCENSCYHRPLVHTLLGSLSRPTAEDNGAKVQGAAHLAAEGLLANDCERVLTSGPCGAYLASSSSRICTQPHDTL